MTSSKTADKAYGLRLVLPGAPNEPHQVHGLTGIYTKDKVTPVGGPGEPTLEQAREAAKGPDAPVELVEIKPNTKTAAVGEED